MKSSELIKILTDLNEEYNQDWDIKIENKIDLEIKHLCIYINPPKGTNYLSIEK